MSDDGRPRSRSSALLQRLVLKGKGEAEEGTASKGGATDDPQSSGEMNVALGGATDDTKAEDDLGKKRSSIIGGIVGRRASHSLLPNSLRKPSVSEGTSPSSGTASPLFGRRSISSMGSMPTLPRISNSGSSTPPAPLDAVPHDEDGPILKQGSLLYLDSKKKKHSGAFVLTSGFLKETAENPSIQPLQDVIALTLERDAPLPFAFCLVNSSGKKVYMGCEDETEQREWILLINAACILYHNSLGVLSYQHRVTMMKEHLVDRFTGGTLKREEIHEEWQYRKSGAVIRQGVQTENAYQWDGSTFEHSKGPNHGKGVWDGLVAAWYPVKGTKLGYESEGGGSAPLQADKVEYEEHASLQYLWSAQNNSYTWLEGTTTQPEDARNWKWSRHFLTKVHGIGHWIAEGSIPPPVAILLQLMRYHRMGFEGAKPAAEPATAPAAEPAASADGKPVAVKKVITNSRRRSQSDAGERRKRRSATLDPGSSTPTLSSSSTSGLDTAALIAAAEAARAKVDGGDDGVEKEGHLAVAVSEDPASEASSGTPTKTKKKGHRKVGSSVSALEGSLISRAPDARLEEESATPPKTSTPKVVKKKKKKKPAVVEDSEAQSSDQQALGVLGMFLSEGNKVSIEDSQ